MRSLLTTLCFAVLVLAQPAWAGRLYLFAENAILPSGSTCTKNIEIQSDRAYTTINCPPGGNNIFAIPFPFPTDAPSTGWTFRVHYQVNQTTASSRCAWDVTMKTFPDNSDATITGGSVTTLQSTSQTHTVNRRYVSPASGAISQILGPSGSPCTGTPSNCADLSAVAKLDMNDGSSTNISNPNSCNFRMLEVRY